MKRLPIALVVVVLSANARPCAAGGSPPAPSEEERLDRFALGAYMSAGMAHGLLRVEDGARADWIAEEPAPRFAGGGGVYFDLHLARRFALDVGIGLVGRGYRSTQESPYGGEYDYEHWRRILCLEIPLGVKADLGGLRLGVALALDVALAGWTVSKGPAEDGGGQTRDSRTWADDDWDWYRRVNFGPKVTLGYAVPIGRAVLVPGISWSMDILDAAWGPKDDDDRGDVQLRGMNLMIDLALELGFGG